MPELFNANFADLCRHQKQPFFELAAGNDNPQRVMRSLKNNGTAPFRASRMYCGRFKNVVVFGQSFVSSAPYVAVFYGQSHQNYDSNAFRDSYSKFIETENRPRPLVAEECCFLGGSGSGPTPNFGHFVFEYLHRLVAFDMVGALGKYPVVVYEDIPEAWLSFVELYGVPRDHIVRVPKVPSVKFTSVWLAACPNHLDPGMGYAFWDEGIHKLHQVLRQKALTDAPSGPKRIFIGRRGAPHRRLLNEDALWQKLEAHGFVYPDFVGLSAAEQIRVIGSAEIVLTVGGAGSVITHFAPKNCIVIEILSPELLGGFGSWGFAAILGQSFSRIPAQAVDKEKWWLADMTVDVEVVEEFVRAALWQLS